jgi:ribosome-associated protein
MDIRKLQKIVVSALEDIKGKDIRSHQHRQADLDVRCVVIATGDSNRQVKALARNVEEKVREPAAK